MAKLVLTGKNLTIDDVWRVSHGHEQVEIAPEALEIAA